MASVFNDIITGKIPAYKIAENDRYLAFLDINPLAEGHTLVIPKKETDYIFDIEQDEYRDLWSFAQKVAKKLKKVIKCKRIGVAVIGLEVAHAHIHLIPINSVGDINFSQPKLSIAAERMEQIASLIETT
jgi:histidine triad (HIT) family protein